MQLPELNLTNLDVAATLYKASRTKNEIMELLGLETTVHNLTKILSRLRDRGLVDRGDIRRQGREETLFAFRLTEEGRRAVLESWDHRVFVMQRFLIPHDDDAHLPEEISFTVRDDDPDRPHRDRHPTPEELEILLAQAAPEFGPPCRLILGARLHARDVCGLLVEDFDRPAGTLAIAGRVAQLSPELQRVTIDAIGERQAGPLFPRPTGWAWNPEALSNAFREARDARDARDAAGLPRDLVLIGRHHNYKGRHRKQSSHAKPDTSRLTRS